MFVLGKRVPICYSVISVTECRLVEKREKDMSISREKGQDRSVFLKKGTGGHNNVTFKITSVSS